MQRGSVPRWAPIPVMGRAELGQEATLPVRHRVPEMHAARTSGQARTPIRAPGTSGRPVPTPGPLRHHRPPLNPRSRRICSTSACHEAAESTRSLLPVAEFSRSRNRIEAIRHRSADALESRPFARFVRGGPVDATCPSWPREPRQSRCRSSSNLGAVRRQGHRDPERFGRPRLGGTRRSDRRS